MAVSLKGARKVKTKRRSKVGFNFLKVLLGGKKTRGG